MAPKPKQMTDHERCQSLIALQNSRLERFDRTRSIQWNFNGILWTGIVVTTAFLAPIRNDLPFTWWGLTLYGPLLVGIHFTVIKAIQSSLDFDKKKFANYNSQADKMLNVENAETDQNDRSKGWLIKQLLISIVLLASSITIILS